MYKPPPPRPKKTNIVRSRTGCRTCRERKQKCDEAKPACGTCVRLGKPCTSIRPDFKFRNVGVPSTRAEPARPERITPGEEEDKAENTAVPSSFGSLDLNLSLQRSEHDIGYATYWEDYCLPALHPVFLFISKMPGSNSMLNDSILALSSCQFSRQQIEPSACLIPHMGNFRPSLSHQARSHSYYSSAIKQMIRASQKPSQTHLTIIVAVLTLFAYIESSVGNFQGVQCHVNGMMQVLRDHPELLDDALNRALIIAWMHVRFVVWWARVYFSSLDVHQRLPPITLPVSLQGCYESLRSRRVAVLSVLCESHRLNSQQVLGYVGFHEPANAASGHAEGVNNGDFETCFHHLDEQRRKLDEWLFYLPPEELPILNGHDETSSTESEDPHTPIYFQTHDAALNFAYYALARVMQCPGLLRSLQNRNHHYYSATQCTEEQSWIELLLRITKSTDAQTTLARNKCTIGFQGLLLAAVLRCQSLAFGLEMQNWVQCLADLQPTEEGSFPIYQTLGVIKAVNREKRAGFDVLGVTQVVDDGGGTPKVMAFNSQPINRLMLHGIWRGSGNVCTKCVNIDD